MKIPRTLARMLIGFYYSFLFRMFGGLGVLSIGVISANFKVDSPLELRRVKRVSSERKIVERVLSKLNKGDCVYDVGANIGTHAIVFSIAVGATGRVVAFEPVNTVATKLKTNIQLNNLSNISVFEKALGSTNGKPALFVNDSVGSGNHTVLKTPGRRVIYVDMVTGDEHIRTHALPVPNVVKIDVEGYELDVISGLIQTLSEPECKLVMCEIHPIQLKSLGKKAQDVESNLRKAGFTNFERFERRSENHLLAIKDN